MATTIKRIYTLALAKIIEAPGTDVDYDSYSPTLLDSLLVEAMPYENAIRAQRGDAELTSTPEVTAIDSTALDWDDRITRVALPWGLAAALLFGEPQGGKRDVPKRVCFGTRGRCARCAGLRGGVRHAA